MGWLEGWGYRKSHVIAGSIMGAQTNYQVKVTAHKGAGVDSGENVYLGANVRDDFGDVRFTDNDGETLLDYWMQELVSGDRAVFWVEVPSIPASPGSATIYIYYGKDDEITTSNGEATFPDLFTHFPGSALPAGWADWYTEYGSRSVADSLLKLDGVTGTSALWKTRAVRTSAQFGLNRCLMFKVHTLVHSNRHCADMGIADQPDEKAKTNRAIWWCIFDHSAHYAASMAAGAQTTSAFTISSGNIVWIARQSGTAKYYRDQALQVTHNTNVPTVDLYVYFGIRWGGATAPTAEKVYIDWVAMRVWCDPEPSHGAWGSEETPPVPPPPLPPPRPIELRLSDVDPPDPDPPRTIYRDLLNLPSPVILGITIRYFNYDDVGLYFRVTGSAPGYTFGTVDMGLLASGADAYRNLDNFASRAKPAAELQENIKLILRAYTDAAYTTLKWTFERTITVIFIDSSDPSYTVDELDNFDDGTVQGWAVANEQGNYSGYPQLPVVTDYVLSAPYSIRMTQSAVGAGPLRGRLYKSFTTPNKRVVYAIIDMRLGKDPAGYRGWDKNVRVQRDGAIIVYLGRPYDAVEARYFPNDKWVRVVTPLPKDTTLEMRLVHEIYAANALSTAYLSYLWIDDFKIISKD